MRNQFLISNFFNSHISLKSLSHGLLVLFPLLLCITRGGADVAISLIGIFFLLSSISQNSWKWSTYPEMTILLVLWLILLVFAWFTPIEPIEAFKLAIAQGRFILFYAAVRFWLLEDAPSIKALNTFGIIVLLLVCLHGFWQYQPNVLYTRLNIPFSTNASIGQYLLKIGLPMFAITMYRVAISGKPYLFLPLGIGLLMTCGVITISGERSSALLMLLAIAILSVLFIIHHPKMRKYVFMGLACITLLLTVLGATQSNVQARTTHLVHQVLDFWNTSYGALFKISWDLWKAYPLTGIGVRQFPAACKTSVVNISLCNVHPHNMYITWAVETGIVALCLIIAAYAAMLLSLRKRLVFADSPGILSAFACASFTILVFPFVITQSPFSNWPAMLHWYALGLTLSLPNLIRTGDPKR